MKKYFFIMAFVLVLVLSGCASSTSTEADSGKTASIDTVNWWDNPPLDTETTHYEVGYAKGSTMQISRDWAKANANTSLAQYVSNAPLSSVTFPLE